MSPHSFRIMGVINVTPDSFSDGGEFLAPATAVERASQLVDAGADVLDLGAESTRPGAAAVPADEEWRRLEPVLAKLLNSPLAARISVDTRKPLVMQRAAAMGVRWINDVAAAADPDLLAQLATYPHMHYIAMHMPFTPDIMQAQPLAPRQALAAVDALFVARRQQLAAAGFAADRCWLDPGIGFGKSDAANVALMQAVPRWSRTQQIAVGVSRKSFIGRALDLVNPKDRDPPSKMLELGLALLGASLIRTHAVGPLKHLQSLLAEGHHA